MNAIDAGYVIFYEQFSKLFQRNILNEDDYYKKYQEYDWKSYEKELN
jgi:hypothetical protein